MQQAATRLAGVPVTPTVNRSRPIAEVLSSMLRVVEHVDANSPENSSERIGFGIHELDSATSYFMPGDFVLIAGRPRMGVRELLITLICQAISQKRPLLWVSTTESAERCAIRIVSAVGAIPLRHLAGGLMTAESWESLSDAIDRTADSPLIINDTPVQTPATIARTVMEVGFEGGLVITDDLQQIAADLDGANLYEATSGVARACKVLARDLGVCVVAGSALSRQPELRNDKKPALAGLRGAGDLEDIVDHVLLTKCEEVYGVEFRPGELDITVAKTPCQVAIERTVTTALQRHYSRVVAIPHVEF